MILNDNSILDLMETLRGKKKITKKKKKKEAKTNKQKNKQKQ